MKTTTLGLLLVTLASACGDDAPSGQVPGDALVAEIKARIERATSSAEQAREALQLLGILPSYECTVDRSSYVAAVIGDLPSDIPCATLSTQVIDGTTDEITATLDGAGCSALGHTLSGVLVLSVQGGTDHLFVGVDALGLLVDGHAVQATASYETCGDATTYSVTALGDVPGHAGATFSVDGSAGLRDGIPIIGATTLILDGTVSVTKDGETDSVTMSALEYDIGDLLPKSGSMTIETASGHSVQVTFHDDTPIVRTVTVEIDDYAPVTIPVAG